MRSLVARRSPATRRHACGLTLVELMVSLTIGLVVLATMAGLFVASSRSRADTDVSADAIETGRHAMDLLARELSQAGYYGTVAAANISGSTAAPCSTNAAEWESSLGLHVLGWNSSPGASDPDPNCIVRKPGTDAIFVQRARGCAVGDSGCPDEVASRGYLQVSECSTEYVSMSASGRPYRVRAGLSGGLTLQTGACSGAIAPKRELIRRLYYIGTDDTLKSIDVALVGVSTPQTLAENIEQMQIEYGVASDASAGSPVLFTATPTAEQWPKVMGARVWVIARSADAAAAVPPQGFEIGEFIGPSRIRHDGGRGPKRRAYTTYIPFVTPQFRMQR